MADIKIYVRRNIKSSVKTIAFDELSHRNFECARYSQMHTSEIMSDILLARLKYLLNAFSRKRKQTEREKKRIGRNPLLEEGNGCERYFHSIKPKERNARRVRFSNETPDGCTAGFPDYFRL